MMKPTRRNWIFCLVTGALCALLAFLPTGVTQSASSAVPRARAKVVSTDNSMLQPLGIAYSGVQQCVVEIQDGQYKGQRVHASNHLNTDIEKDKLFSEGDEALVMLTVKDGQLTSATLIDHYRLGAQGLLFGLFGLLLVLFAGVSGAGALISLVLSVLVVWKLLVPAVLLGWSPLLCAIVVVIGLTIMIDLLVAGFTRTALVAVIGSLLGTALTCALSFGFGNLLKLDGSSLPYVVPIIAQGSMQLDLREIFFSMVFIANSGALMDLSMDVSSAATEIVKHNPGVTRRELLRSCFNVGRNVVGTMTTTLMLAYSGSYLSLLMYFAGQGTPVIDIVNLKYVASEVLITLVGSFGLVAVAPFTAVVAAGLRGRKASGIDTKIAVE